MALDLARRGFDVAVHYNGSAEAAEEVVAEISRRWGAAAALQADLLDERRLGRSAQLRRGAWRAADLLVNNASIFEYDDIESATRESWDRHIESNLRAPFVLTQAFAAQVPPSPGLTQMASRWRRAWS